MTMKFEYRICNAQESRITFVNGDWQGTGPPDEEESLESCPEVWIYLQTAGMEGWELVTVVSRFRSRGKDEPILDRLFFESGQRGWHTWDTIYLKRTAE